MNDDDFPWISLRCQISVDMKNMDFRTWIWPQNEEMQKSKKLEFYWKSLRKMPNKSICTLIWFFRVLTMDKNDTDNWRHLRNENFFGFYWKTTLLKLHNGFLGGRSWSCDISLIGKNLHLDTVGTSKYFFFLLYLTICKRFSCHRWIRGSNQIWW